MSARDPKDNWPFFVLILIFVLLASGLTVAGYFYYQNYERHYKAGVDRQLSAVADLKVGEILLWRKERLADAAAFYKNNAFSSLVASFFKGPVRVKTEDQLRSWLSQVRAAYHYDRIALLDGQGVERMSVPGRPKPVAPYLRKHVSEILRSRKVTFLDFHREAHDQEIHLSVLVPILAKSDSRRAIGTLIFKIDPGKYLYPFIQRRPTPSKTAETLLVRREGNEVVFLNELRFQKNTALALRISLKKKDLPAGKAVLGQEGIAEGIDYRGVPVLASLRAVPDSPWFLIAKQDRAEVYAPLKERRWLMVALVSLLIIGSGAGVGLVWRRQRSVFWTMYAAEQERSWLQDVIARSLNEVFVFDPQTLRFKFANTGACRNLGYSPEELYCLTTLEINSQLTEEAFLAMVQSLRDGERQVLVFETIHRRKDGSEYPAEIHLQLVAAGDDTVFLAISNDMTERKQSEEALRKSEERFSALFDQAPLGYQSLDEDGRFIEVNQAWLDTLGYGREEIMGKWFGEFLAPEFVDAFRERFPLFKATGRVHSEFQMLHKSGGRRIMAFEGRIGYKPDGNFKQAHCILSDITESKQAEKRLHASLLEKELLVREVHHRVKNNMQVMLSLLNLQAQTSGNPELSQMLGESQSRIRSMALVHEKLYDSKDVARIDLAGYVKTLVLELFQTYQINPAEIDLIIQTDEVYVEISKAIPCGLILNELISNALKHTFPENGHSQLQVILRETKNTEIEIVVQDNGLGLSEDIDLLQPKTVGLYLVKGLVTNQLGGQIEVKRGAGTEFRITFPL